MVRPSIDQDSLLRHFKNELTEKFKEERNVLLFRIVDPHFNINITIKGDWQTNIYHIITEASLKQDDEEWSVQATDYWDKQKNEGPIKEAEKAIINATKDLESEIVYRNDLDKYTNNWVFYETKKRIEEYETILAKAKKQLEEAKKNYGISYTLKQTLNDVASSFFDDYKLAKMIEKEHEEKEKETEELSSQFGYEEEAASPQQKDEVYFEQKNLSRGNVIYEIGTIIKLHNPSDTTIAIYKDESLSNITNLFANGIRATIIDFKVFTDKPSVYKVQITLKNDTEYTGWVSEHVISN